MGIPVMAEQIISEPLYPSAVHGVGLGMHALILSFPLPISHPHHTVRLSQADAHGQEGAGSY